MKPIRPFQHELNKFMDSFFSNSPFLNQHALEQLYRAASSTSPSFQVQETKNEYILEASLPQMRAKDIDILIKQRTITIRGETKESIEGRNDRNGMYIQQTKYGSFSRTFPLPADAEVHRMKVEYKHERLTIRIPKG